jgi:RNase H-fold protein (predicted Holliday junction resolvase)
MAICLAVDLGIKRSGLAWCADAGMVEPLAAVEAGRLDATLARRCEEFGIELLVFGLPLRRGRIGEAARATRRRAYSLAAAIGLPLVFVDESHTTDEARTSWPGRDKDAIAAALILTRFLSDGPWEAPRRKMETSS